MAWGGFIDKKGSKYLKKMGKTEKILKYLELIKRELNNEEKVIVEKTIQIICDYINNLREVQK